MSNGANWVDNRFDLDREDATEAFTAFHKARGLFFWILLLGMLLAEAAFWTVNLGYIDPAISSPGNSQYVHQTSRSPGLILIAELTPPAGTAEDNQAEAEKSKQAAILADVLRISLRVIYMVLPFAAVLYCLSLLIGMKLSLIARLGGLADSGKAFFLSLIVMVLVVPWMQVISEMIPGTLFNYNNLIESYRLSREGMNYRDNVIYHGRFVGIMVFTIIILLTAQWRSRSAVKKIRANITALPASGKSMFINHPQPTSNPPATGENP